MAYKAITQYNSPNYTPAGQVPAVYGRPRVIEGITYHWWDDPAKRPTFEGIVSYLCRPNGSTSAHVVGEAGRIAWIIDAGHAAWHAGNPVGNATTVGYECNPRLSDGDYETMGEFHYDMEKAYGRRLSIYVHKEWSSTTCSPIDKGRIRAIADKYHKGGNMLEYKRLTEGKIWIEMKLDKVHEWDLTSGPNYKAKATYSKGQVVAVTHYIDTNGTRYYVTDPSVMNGYKFGFNVKDVITHRNDPVEAKKQRELVEERKASIVQIYKEVLDRAPTPGETDYYLRQMANGRGLSHVRDDLLHSSEHHRNRTSKLEGEVGGIKALLERIATFLSDKLGFKK